MKPQKYLTLPSAFLKQTVNQGAQGVLVLQCGISTSASAGVADHPGAVDDDDLGDVQNFVSAPAEIAVHVLLCGIAHGIGELEVINNGGQKLRAGIRGVGRVEDDADRLETARAQLTIKLVERLGDAHAMLRFNEKKLHDHDLAFESGELCGLAGGNSDGEFGRFPGPGNRR